MIREISAWWERVEKRVQRIQPPQARRFIVAVVGSTVLLVGLLMLALPGPAFVVIPAGLAILALEFAWARHWLERVRKFAKQAADTVMPGTGRAAAAEAAKGRTDAHRMPS